MSTSRAWSNNWNRRRRLPPESTYHLPGTEGKMEVMQERLERGFHLHHPGDAQALEPSLDVPQRCLGHRAGSRKLLLPRNRVREDR